MYELLNYLKIEDLYFQVPILLQVLQGEGQGILPGHKKTKVVVQMLKEEADQHDQLAFLQEGTPYRFVGFTSGSI